MTLFLLVKYFNNVLWVTEPLLIGEMAPTSTRNLFCGIVGFIGKIGSITAPYFNHLVGFLMDILSKFITKFQKTINETAPAITLAFFSLTAALLALCSPETMNVPMPEDIDGFNPGPVYSWIFGKQEKKNKMINVEVGSSQQLDSTVGNIF